ncbi:class I SAM-dependent methyltransferase, partial [Pararobbsia alpina]|uniref:class I SAM-dependent methyltransferase n=1 Tax=Pararobbsia alpina TaxID=621374 RepID=UPI001582E4F1
MSKSIAQTDAWSEWLLNLRHAGDPEFHHQVRSLTTVIADRVIDAAQLEPESTLVDIGTGDGLVAFRAIERFGPSLKVILTDVSAPMLEHVEAIATSRGVREQCEFIHCGADDLHDIADASCDAVTTRAVLAYVPDKQRALLEFHRILKPGGRLSIAEPIMLDEAVSTSALRNLAKKQVASEADLIVALMHRWKSAQYPDNPQAIAKNPLTNFNERDLVRFAMAAAFEQVHMELHIKIVSSIFTSWEIFVGSSPHPFAPTL